MNRSVTAFSAAAGCAILAPVLLLTDRADAPPAIQIAAPVPISPSRAGTIDAPRDLFGGAIGSPTEPGAAEPRGGTPRVIGIVGRLPDRAVALVRGDTGGTRTVGVGEIVDGWRLESIAADAVLFARGDRRERVEVTTGAAADQ